MNHNILTDRGGFVSWPSTESGDHHLYSTLWFHYCYPLIPGLYIGAASGTGCAAAEILASRGVKVYILDLGPPDDEKWHVGGGIEYVCCDITSWAALRGLFNRVSPSTWFLANAGVSKGPNSFRDSFDEDGFLQERRMLSSMSTHYAKHGQTWLERYKKAHDSW